MSGNADRIRRILADHGAPTAGGSAVRRAADVPPPALAAPPAAPAAPGLASPAPTPATPSAAPTARGLDDPARLALLERLRSLHVETIGRGTDARRGPAVADGPVLTLDDFEDDDDRPLDVRLGAERRVARKGVYWLVERRFPLASRHGAEVLATAFERAIPLRQRERRPGGRRAVHPSEAVFLDVETTGLAGGTGTLAFLVGLARRVGDDLVLRQYFVPDFPDEAAVLEALADDLGDAPLVTFNGRTFDAPLLATRFRLHRIPLADRDHLDLLPPARRLWAGSLASHALGSLERGVLGVTRTEDLPGALVPAAYFAWLRDGRASALALAFRHNETDLVSLVTLAGVVARLVDDPTSRPSAPAEDHLHTARLLLDQGAATKARACLVAAAAVGGEPPAPVLRLLASLQRREGDLDAALATWTGWLETAASFDPHPYEEIAKHLEHRAKDAPRALGVVERALARCPATDARRADLERRRARLARKAGKARATPAVRRSSGSGRKARRAADGDDGASPSTERETT